MAMPKSACMSGVTPAIRKPTQPSDALPILIAAAVRQSGTSARKEISQLPVIQAEKPENREKNVIGVHRILARPETDPVGRSDDILTLDFAALADTNSLLISASQRLPSDEIRDPNGAAIAGAAVTITQPSTGLSRAVTSDSGSHHEVRYLIPGEYTVVVKAPDFRRERQAGS
jgi:Carboxypeptidase regulatory-like domain